MHTAYCIHAACLSTQLAQDSYNNNNNDNNNQDNVYGAVIMIQSLREFTRFILMNADWAPGGRQPSDQTNRYGLWVRQKIGCYHPQTPSPFIIITQLVSWYSSHFTIPRRVEGWRSSSYISKMTFKPSKLGQTGQAFGLWSEFISRSAQ